METRQNVEFTTIDEYIALQPEQIRVRLKQLRQIIKKAAPEAEEVISYQMPAYKFHGMLVWFAAFKNHFSMYPFPKVLHEFKEKLGPYLSGKATVKFPLDEPLPDKLITEIVQYRVKENPDKKVLKEMAKSKKAK